MPNFAAMSLAQAVGSVRALIAIVRGVLSILRGRPPKRPLAVAVCGPGTLLRDSPVHTLPVPRT